MGDTFIAEAEVRRRVADLISEIEAETLAMHGRRGTVPAGARAARKMHPHHRPEKTKKSPAPRFHAYRKKVRKRLEHALPASSSSTARLRSVFAPVIEMSTSPRIASRPDSLSFRGSSPSPPGS